jgi:hypothetical protein
VHGSGRLERAVAELEPFAARNTGHIAQSINSLASVMSAPAGQLPGAVSLHGGWRSLCRRCRENQSRARLGICAVFCVFCSSVLAVIYWSVICADVAPLPDAFLETTDARPAERSLPGDLKWCVDHFEEGRWSPCGWLSLIAETRLWASGARGLRVSNVSLHAITATLLFAVLLSTAGGLVRAALVAVIFAVHPLCVDAVAWLPGRGETLGALLGIASLLAYCRYARAPCRRTLVVAFISFVCGALSDPALIVLPFLMLLLDFWPLGRCEGPEVDASGVPGDAIPSSRARTYSARLSGDNKLWPLVIEKWAFFATSVVLGVVASLGQAGSLQVWSVRLVASRLIGVPITFAKCLVTAIVPYQHTDLFGVHSSLDTWVVSALVGLLVISALATVLARRLPFVFVGWLWYCATLFVAVGLAHIGARPTTDADSYFALIGLFIAIVWCVPLKHPVASLTGIVSLLILINVSLFGAMTVSRVAEWRDRQRIIGSQLRSSPAEPVRCALELSASARRTVIISRIESAARWPNNRASLHESLAFALQEVGRLDAAEENYNTVIELDELRPLAHYNLALILLQRQYRADAERHFWRALELDPRLPWPYAGLAELCRQRGEDAEADRYLKRAQELCSGLLTGRDAAIPALEPHRPAVEIP